MYKFRDPDGRVVYVGKAINLRNRLNSYFADITRLHPRTAQMVTTAGSVEWTVVSTEVEALQLEFNWIKEFDPRFNVRFRDDKSYPELAVTIGDEVPRLYVTRGNHRKGVKYFGPYPHAWAIRETLDLLLRVFPARTCSPGVFRRAQLSGRPCLLAYIGKCSAPCVGWVTVEQHRQIVDDFCEFMSGKTRPLTRRLEREMRQASDSLEFERAARLRDDLAAVKQAMEKQAVVLTDGTDADVVGVVGDQLQAAVQVFHVRGGRVRGQRGWVIDTPVVGDDDGEDREAGGADADHGTDADADHGTDAGGGPDPDDALPVAAVVEEFLLQFYGRQVVEEGSAAVPKEILVPALPADTPTLTSWLRGLRGSNVSLRIPQRGDKRALADTVRRNAAEALKGHRLKRASDLTARSAALSDIATTLGMDASPLRIECTDISHVQGTNVVASLVVFEDGLPKKSDYRRFAIREHPGDDVASIAEVVRRRFAHGAGQPENDEQTRSDDAAGPGEQPPGGETPGEQAPDEKVPGEQTPGIDPDTGRPRRFAYPPQLLVVDGGGPQVNAAAAVLDELGIVDVTVCGLAKRLEEVWLPNQDDPVIFPRTSEALYLLQRLRDEAHRFAITYHRAKRSKSMTASALDTVPGLGPTRKRALLRHFGSVKSIRAATPEEVATVPGIGPAIASAIVDGLSEHG